MSLTEIEKQRYARQIMLPGWGIETQLLLKQARVLVVGSGALGCAVLQNLARAGVGTLGIADDDVVSVSNLQRQVLFDEGDVGFLKAVKAAEKISAINSLITTEIFCERVYPGNVVQLLEKYDVIVDGTDNFSSKYLLNDVCVLLNKPLVAASIEGFEGQLSVYNYKNGPSYRCIFPHPAVTSSATDCNAIGVSPTLPLLLGNLQANEVLKIISRNGEVLSGKLMVLNTLSNAYSFFSFALRDENRNADALRSKYDFEADEFPVMVEAADVALMDKLQEVFLMDVRDEHEHAQSNRGGVNIPLYEIEERMAELPDDKALFTYCNSGLKAKQAALLISKAKKRKVYYLDGSF